MRSDRVGQRTPRSPGGRARRSSSVATALLLGLLLAAPRAGGADELAAGEVDEAGAEARFDALLAAQNAPVDAVAPDLAVLEDEALQDGGPPAARVELPLAAYAELRARLRALAVEAVRREAPALVMGAADYTCEGRREALALTLDLQVRLGRAGTLKFVPLAGEDVVLVGATLDGAPVPVSVREGYHVWVTDRVGPARLKVELLVPARGPRGSIEYDFVVARTPVTHLACRFPQEGLEPRVDQAVDAEVRSADGATVLAATLRPTVRVHMVGFRDLSEGEARTARVFAESTSLLSVDAGALELFAVVRYTILYAGAREFRIALPEDVTVLAVDGESAFRFVVEKAGGETIIRGETETPIRNRFEISMHVRREIPRAAAVFTPPLPRCLGVEREAGWLAVEVPGRLRLEEEARGQAVAVDVRQLPPDMVQSAVSPILRAYRYHAPPTELRLRATGLAETEPASASIDEVRAFSVVAPEGTALTELRITLRNRLRHSLALVLPDGAEVRSTLLDGAPVQVSRDEAGRLLLPLRRSAGRGEMEAFMLQLVIAHRVGGDGPLGWLGTGALALPAIDLPVSSLAWSVFLPGQNLYSELEGALAPQTYLGQATWRAAPVAEEEAGDDGEDGAAETAPVAAALADSAEAGAMPVRIVLPKEGARREYTRYWMAAETPVTVRFTYVRAWPRIPAAALLALLLAAGVVVAAGTAARRPGRAGRWAGALVAAATVWPLAQMTAAWVIAGALLLAVGVVALRRRWARGIVEATAASWRGVVAHVAAWRPREALAHPVRLGFRVLLGAAAGGLLVLLVRSAWAALVAAGA